MSSDIADSLGRMLALQDAATVLGLPTPQRLYATWIDGNTVFRGLDTLSRVDRKVQQLRGIEGYYYIRRTNWDQPLNLRFEPASASDICRINTVRDETIRQYALEMGNI